MLRVRLCSIIPHQIFENVFLLINKYYWIIIHIKSRGGSRSSQEDLGILPHQDRAKMIIHLIKVKVFIIRRSRSEGPGN